ncbi:MAG: hypothetical protein ACOH5I_06515 [Oligoflexus sp.]
MRNLFITRRNLAKASCLLIPGQLFALNALGSVSYISSEDKIFSILQKHYQLNEADRSLVPAFLARLLTPGLSTQKAEVFSQWLLESEAYSQELATYVVEEFVVASNYFAVLAGQEDKLRILA